MKTQCTRTVDPQGRVSIPGYLRELTGINPGEVVTVEADDKGIRIYATGDCCCICGGNQDDAPLLKTTIGPFERKFCVSCARTITTTLNKKEETK